MRKFMSVLLLCCMMAMTLAGCNKNKEPENSPTSQNVTQDDSSTEATTNTEATADAEGMVDGKFLETREITVEVYDRDNDGGSDPTNNAYTKWIQEGMLRDHNVKVTFVSVPRWTEVEQINNLLASASAPDVCVTYNYATITTYAGMGGVLDLSSYVDDYKDRLPNLWNWLGETNIYWDKTPTYNKLWAIESKLAVMNRISTFVREDWLKKLNIAEPTTLEEFEAMLVAFRDNAKTLLGADADKMVPFSTSFDVGWRTDHLTGSFLDNNITDYDFYVNGFDDRRLLQNGTKEGIRVLNKWYNEGLVWKDFALYPAGDTTEDNMMKAGFVGAFIHNWDYPYRNGENSIQYSLQQLVGPDAGFIAVEPFKNAAGVYKKFLAGPIDRKIFFPSTNDEPLASLLYLDWISAPENRQYLQIGAEGVTNEKLDDGSFKTIAATGDNIMNSPYNIDYTITCNGLDLGDKDITIKSIGNGYANVDKRYIEKAFPISTNEGRIDKNVRVGTIAAESGMGPALNTKRDTLLDQAVVAPTNKFDEVYDAGISDYLSSGGQAIIDERKAAWALIYGDVTDLPQ